MIGELRKTQWKNLWVVLVGYSIMQEHNSLGKIKWCAVVYNSIGVLREIFFAFIEISRCPQYLWSLIRRGKSENSFTIASVLKVRPRPTACTSSLSIKGS